MANYYIIGGLSINGTDIPFYSVSWDPTIEKMLKNSGARAGHSFTGVATSAPVCKIKSPALATVLGLTGLNGVAITAFTVHQIKYGPLGIAAGSSHRKWTMTAGIARLDSINGNANSGDVNIEVHAAYDGTNAAWVLTDSVAAPTDTGVDEVFYLGPLFIGTTEYAIKSITYNAGTETLVEFTQGDPWPSLVAIKPRKPTVSIESFDGVLGAVAGAVGANIEDVVLFFRKGDVGSGLRTADATEEHIQIDIPAAFITPDAIDGTPGQEVNSKFMLDVGDDGTNAITTLDTTAAIATPA